MEDEEERLEQEGFYDSDSEVEDEGVDEIREKAQWIRDKQKKMIVEARNRKSLKNKAIMPRDQVKKSFGEMEEHMYSLGHDTEASFERKSRKEIPSQGVVWC